LSAALQDPALASRLAALDWNRLAEELLERGFATTSPVLDAAACAALRSVWDDGGAWRKHVSMARHGYGRGEYRYFGYPLPATVQMLREGLYPPLARVAGEWARRLREARTFPGTLEEFLAACHGAGQCRPTPLLLRYGSGDYNCLHQDLYGAIHFPFQAALLLSEPDVDFSGGEIVLVEQRPRAQSRATVVPLHRGELLLFAVDARPRAGPRGWHRVRLRHGVSELGSGERFTLGIIFHDAG